MPVLDASAILAMIQNEPGHDVVRRLVFGSSASTVNIIEVATRLLDSNVNVSNLKDQLFETGLKLIPLDTELALAAANLRIATRHKGLSLADRVCLALAIRENAVAVTADKAWAELDVGCEIELIR